MQTLLWEQLASFFLFEDRYPHLKKDASVKHTDVILSVIGNNCNHLVKLSNLCLLRAQFYLQLSSEFLTIPILFLFTFF